jgi:hypothetical protein
MIEPARKTSPAKPIAGTIGAVFGGLWGVVGTLALPVAERWLAAATISALTIAILWRLWRAPPAKTAPLFGRRAYRWAVGFELVAIYIASVLLPRWGLQPFFVPVVGIIVGLHFVGLYRATRARRFLAICAGMVVVSAAATLLPGAAHGLSLRDAATGFGNALVLWIGVAALR